MTNLEIAEFLGTRCETIDEVIAFLEGDCGVTGVTKQKKNNSFYSNQGVHVTMPESTLYFFREQQIYEGYLGYDKEFIQNLLPLLTPEEKAKVTEVVTGMKERSKPVKASGGKGPAVVNNITNNNSATASNYNYNDIKTFSQLSAHLESRVDIQNKVEIQNTLSALEEAKDGGSADSYVGLLIKLVGLLCKDGILPPFMGKLVDGLGKWFK